MNEIETKQPTLEDAPLFSAVRKAVRESKLSDFIIVGVTGKSDGSVESVDIMTTDPEVPEINWIIGPDLVIKTNNPDNCSYGREIYRAGSVEALARWLDGYLYEVSPNYAKSDRKVSYYFSFAVNHPYRDTFCRVTVSDSPKAYHVANLIMVDKFGADWGFQYTQKEFDGFPQEPWWTGKEHVVDIGELKYLKDWKKD